MILILLFLIRVKIDRIMHTILINLFNLCFWTDAKFLNYNNIIFGTLVILEGAN